jgi:hypothetical protein
MINVKLLMVKLKEHIFFVQDMKAALKFQRAALPILVCRFPSHVSRFPFAVCRLPFAVLGPKI